MPSPKSQSDLSVSVIVPCRNERGNIAEAIRRIPDMGKHTEIIFIDGNSKDGTADEIELQIKAYPDRDIKLLNQGSGIGKGDADQPVGRLRLPRLPGGTTVGG